MAARQAGLVFPVFLANLAGFLATEHGCAANDPEDADTAWLQTAQSSSHAAQLSQRECDKDDLACEARQLACNLTGMIETVCEGGHLNLYEDAVPRRLTRTRAAARNSSGTSSVSLDCPAALSCVPDVIAYEGKNPGAEIGMTTAKVAATVAVETLKEILSARRSAMPEKALSIVCVSFQSKIIGRAGGTAFAFIGGFLDALFPSAGGLPEWTVRGMNSINILNQPNLTEQVKPFVQQFVNAKLDETFEELWKSTIEGYQTRLWAMNATAYRSSEHFENGTIKHMPNKTRQRMFDELKQVHDAMLGDVRFFLTDHAIKTTARSYLCQFASLHISVMTNLLGSSDYQTLGDRYVFQTFSMCYAKYVYKRATEAFKSRMATFMHSFDGSMKYCPMVGVYNVYCLKGHETYKDEWPDCNWEFNGRTVTRWRIRPWSQFLFG
ncbi:unnamed protein product [Symbiodinium natans]|uniref:Uncharacterized protein n=1 Tax=Symbiodinium natans TaxID=878477 RepID=A0A812PIU1_9DINO|nr:unnamed protein product [Symbiodinium natans]